MWLLINTKQNTLPQTVTNAWIGDQLINNMTQIMDNANAYVHRYFRLYVDMYVRHICVCLLNGCEYVNYVFLIGEFLHDVFCFVFYNIDSWKISQRATRDPNKKSKSNNVTQTISAEYRKKIQCKMHKCEINEIEKELKSRHVKDQPNFHDF